MRQREIYSMRFDKMTKAELSDALKSEQARYDELKGRGLKLNMSRGIPSLEQLALSKEFFHNVDFENAFAEDGTDCRNYGVPFGLPELRKLFAGIMGADADNVIIGGNSSLNLMFDMISQAMLLGFGGEPWLKQGKIKFLCPAPGYDRHFKVCETLGIEMITVPMTVHGPDMDTVERLVASDDMIKGMWCVPKYSNPQGYIYSDETVKRLASMKTAAADFRIFWDNAYVVHSLYGDDHLASIIDECAAAGNPDRPIVFASTSKIVYAGAGVSAVASSADNMKLIKARITTQTIGPDKINELRHMRMFKTEAELKAHMEKHAAILRPKFEAVIDVFERELGGTGLAEWTNPRGGYFISVDTLDGCASETVAMCKEAGVVFTPAGATYPYGKDPWDKNIRIAPTSPSVDELKLAMELFCIALKIVSAKKIIENA
ncbi:MAG TPA: aminotransferase class I/II-fold pyridoxal phosphate-dependent enzyme [Firmicutes bacterium]|nr:aminotransferase class I/II-fold pyridoxal phosphate-dependent enzyme [Bacillota bacterium]